MTIIQPFDGAFGTWRDFARRHRGRPSLELDPLYSLPEPLIDAILREVPGLFGPEDEAFERDLVRTAYGGFFHRGTFSCLLLARPPEAQWVAQQQRLRASKVAILKDAGLSDLRVRDYFEAADKRREDVKLRRLAYSGWLVTNPQFRAESDQLRVYGEIEVKALGHFPWLPRTYLGESPWPKEQGHEPFFQFNRRWGLDSMITWELPCPLEPELSGIITLDIFNLSEAGITFFLPWYLLRDKNFKLDALAEHLAIDSNPAHLKDWLKPKSGARKSLGYVRLGNVLKLYRFRRLALAARYRDRLTGQTERLDQAFATFLRLDAQSVRKLRLAVKGIAED